MAQRAAQALQRARGVAYWKKLMEESARKAADMDSSDSMRHWWRPPHEDSRVLKSAAKAAGLAVGQLRVKEPLRMVYDEQAEVPLHLLPSTPPNIVWRTTWAGKFARKKLDDYQVTEVLQHIYAQERQQVVKAGGHGGPENFSDCRSGPVMLKTFQKAGSVALMEFGTCLVKRKYVVVDAGPWFKIQVDRLLSTVGVGLGSNSKGSPYKSWICPTWSCLLTIPKPAFDASAYKLLTLPKYGEEMFTLPGTKLELNESLRFQLNREREIGLELDDKFGGEAAIKVAVEIDRMMLGKGNIVFFEPADVADDAEKVWDRLSQLDKSVMSCSLAGLKLHRLEHYSIRYAHKIAARVYLLIPEFMDPEEDIPFCYHTSCIC